jgi:hypothetical protein
MLGCPGRVLQDYIYIYIIYFTDSQFHLIPQTAFILFTKVYLVTCVIRHTCPEIPDKCELDKITLFLLVLFYDNSMLL